VIVFGLELVDWQVWVLARVLSELK